jgi:Zn-dependent protease
MLLNEPPRSQGDLNFAILGFPVRINPWFWLVALLLGRNLHGVPAMLTWIAALLISILVHEFGHAAVMRIYGFYPSITLYGMGGVTSYNWAQTIGGVRPRLRAIDQIAISLAGPVAGFLLAGVVYGAVVLSGYEIDVRVGMPDIITIEPMELIGPPMLTFFIIQILYVGVFWGLVNLLPVFPLDGGQIAREVFAAIFPSDGVRLSLILSTLVAVVLAIMAWTQWDNRFGAVMFAILAFESYAALQSPVGGGGPW